MLNHQELSALGYVINPDPEQPGRYCWDNGEAASGTFTTPADAMIDASEHLIAHQEIYRCEICGTFQESLCGIVIHRCAHCNGASVEPVALPDWDEVMEAFGLDPSFVWNAEQQVEYTRAYLGWTNTVTV